MSAISLFSYQNRFYPVHITINVILTTFLAVFAAVSTMIANSVIQGELALSHTESIWLTTLNLLGVNTIVPTGNWFANRFGYNRTYTFGVLLFSAASLLAGISTHFWMIASSRFLEGVGAGFIFPVGLSLIVKSLPKEKITLGINLYVGLAFGLGLSVGIYLSGLLSQFYSWRIIFFIISPLASVSAISCWLCRRAVIFSKGPPFDYFGFLTFAGFVSTLLIALTLGPIQSTNEGFRTPYIILCFFLAFLFFIACLSIESRHPNPLIPLALFKNPTFSLSLAAMFLLGMGVFASMSVAIDYMINGLFYEKYTAGKIASIYGVTIGLFSMLASLIPQKIPRSALTLFGLTLLIISYFWNNELSWLTGYKELIPILILRGIGIGLALGPTTNLALNQISEELKSPAATILTFFRQLGGTYGSTLLAIFSIRRTIFHTERFSETVNSSLPGYKQTFQKLTYLTSDPKTANLLIEKNLKIQAYIQGINDSLFIFGYITLFFALTLFSLILYNSLKKTEF